MPAPEPYHNTKIVIVFFIDFLANSKGESGGTERQLIEKINLLNRSDFEPVLICLQEFSKNRLMQMVKCEKYIIGIYSLLSFSTIKKIFKLRSFFNKKNTVILEVNFYDSIIVGTLCKIFKNVRLVSCRRDLGFWHNKRTKMTFILLNKFCKAFLVNSEAVKNQLIINEHICEKHISVVPNGIDLENIDKIQPINLHKEYSISNKSIKFVGLVANFNRNVKRIDIFIKSISVVAKTQKNVMFVIVGQGCLFNEYNKLAHNLGVNNLIIWSGKVENSIKYIKSFDIGVLSSDSEGFSNSILEYMASKIPVVATDVGGNSEIIQDGINGFLVPKGDFHLLGKKICILLKNEDMSHRMGMKGREMIENDYSWKRVIKRYENYYKDLIIAKC